MKSTQNTEDPDRTLVEKTAAGDGDAFGELVKKHEHSVLNTIYRYIGSYNEAEDIAQEVFIKVWKKAGSFRGRSMFSTWLYRIVVNQCLNYKSKHRRQLVSLDETMEKGRTPDALKVEIELEQREKAEIVRRALDELPERQRIALVLSRFEGRAYKEIAEIMGVSLSSVESLIFRGKENLRKRFLPLRERREI